VNKAKTVKCKIEIMINFLANTFFRVYLGWPTNQPMKVCSKKMEKMWKANVEMACVNCLGGINKKSYTNS